MDKNKLKEELVDLRMKLAEAENQALKIKKRPWVATYHFKIDRLITRTHKTIQKADNDVCELAKLLGLDKMKNKELQ